MESYCSLCTLDTIHRLFFVTRLIINIINKVQWVDFKLENVLVSLHSLKTMGLGSIIFKEWRVTWTFSYTKPLTCRKCFIEFTLPSVGFKLTTLVVIGTDCTGSCKSNYHRIKTTKAPSTSFVNLIRLVIYSTKWNEAWQEWSFKTGNSDLYK